MAYALSPVTATGGTFLDDALRNKVALHRQNRRRPGQAHTILDVLASMKGSTLTLAGGWHCRNQRIPSSNARRNRLQSLANLAWGVKRRLA